MAKAHTERGFALMQFKDRYGSECSLQESSLATESCIWFGVDKPSPHILVSDAKRLGLPYEGESGWCAFKIPSEVSITTRMHLTQDQVKELLPHLIRFSETGEL